MQIYYGVENDLQCPLTVREGRNWLSSLFDGRKIQVPSIGEEPRREEETGVPAITPVSYTHLDVYKRQ